MDEHISTFASITGASPEVARSFLEMTAGNFERAIELFFENPDLASGVGAGLSSTSTDRPAAASRSNTGRQDAQGVIHIDSDDDMDMQFADEDSDREERDRVAANQAAAVAQEEEDMAMARRLQEEMYQGNAGSGAGAEGFDEVRAPIARTTETLVAPGGWDGGEDDSVHSAILEQLRRRTQQRHPPGNFT